MNQVREFIEYILNLVKIWVIIQPWQQGIRVRIGKNRKLLNPGIHFKIPYFDSVFVQETRMRIVDMPLQSISCKDQTITLNASFGYTISNIDRLYLTLFHPETTLKNLTMAKITDYISVRDFADIKLNDLENYVLTELKSLDYGIQFTTFQIMNYASVKTYRLIQDRAWTHEGLDMNGKKQ